MIQASPRDSAALFRALVDLISLLHIFPAPVRRARSTWLPALLLSLGLMLLPFSALQAQEPSFTPPLLKGGDGVVTGFSGTVERAGKPFIDMDGAAAKIMALSRTGLARGQLEMPPVRREIPAREVGQVFGIAIDNMVPANVYLGATAAYGLRIVTPDADGDGVPEIALKGQPGAQ